MAALLFIVLVLIWGSTWFGIHLQDNGTPATAAVAIRFAIAALLLWCWALATERRVAVPAGSWPLAVVPGLTFFCFNYLLIYIGTQTVPSGLVSVLFSVVIIWSLGWEVLLLRRFPGWSAVVAAVVGLAGLALLFEREILAGEVDAAGASIILAAALVASTGNTLSQVLLSRGMAIVPMSTVGMSIGAAAMLLIALARGDLARVRWDLTFVGSLLYLAVVGSIAAFGLYFQLVRKLGPTRAAYSSVFFPLVALAISALFEHYVMTLAGWTGVALLLVGAALAVGRHR